MSFVVAVEAGCGFVVAVEVECRVFVVEDILGGVCWVCMCIVIGNKSLDAKGVAV